MAQHEKNIMLAWHSCWHGLSWYWNYIYRARAVFAPCKHQQPDYGPVLAYYLWHILIFALYKYDSNKCIQLLCISREIRYDIVVQCTIHGVHIMSCNNNATVTSKQRCYDVWCDYDVIITSFICCDIYTTFCMSRRIHITAICHFV